MGGERLPDFLFGGLIILPPEVFADGLPMVAFFLFFALLIGDCLLGSGPWEPDDTLDKAAQAPDPNER